MIYYNQLKAESHCFQKYNGKIYLYMYQHLQVNLLSLQTYSNDSKFKSQIMHLALGFFMIWGVQSPFFCICLGTFDCNNHTCMQGDLVSCFMWN